VSILSGDIDVIRGFRPRALMRKGSLTPLCLVFVQIDVIRITPHHGCAWLD